MVKLQDSICKAGETGAASRRSASQNHAWSLPILERRLVRLLRVCTITLGLTAGGELSSAME